MFVRGDELGKKSSRGRTRPDDIKRRGRGEEGMPQHLSEDRRLANRSTGGRSTKGDKRMSQRRIDKACSNREKGKKSASTMLLKTAEPSGEREGYEREWRV